MNKEEAKKIIEALLFASDRPLVLDEIKEVLEEFNQPEIKDLIFELKNEYETSGHAFQIREIAQGYQLTTDSTYAPWLKKLYKIHHKERLTTPSLETLAIVAYKQPITRTEIELIRGVNVDGVINTLLERNLVKIAGRKEVIGRPFVYGTTREFLEYFGLKSLEDLPKLEEFVETAQAQETGEQKVSEPAGQVINNEVKDDSKDTASAA